MYITIRAGYTMTIKEIRQHKNNTIRQQIFTYLIHVRKEISFIDTRFFTVSFIPMGGKRLPTVHDNKVLTT